MTVLQIKNSLVGRLSEKSRVVIAAIFVGAMAGLATFLLKTSMSHLEHFLTDHFDKTHANYMFLIYPTIGILLATIFQTLIRENLAHGTEQLKHRLNQSNFRIKRNMIASPLIACLLTVGFGGSAGAEGPSAFSGAAIGDRTSRWFGLTPYATRIIFGCGAAAGIAGIFKSPIGGVMFAIEVLRMELTVLGLLAVTCASLTAFSISYILSGFTWNVTLLHPQAFDPGQIWWIILLGIVCGAYSLYYDSTQKMATKFFEHIANKWVRAILCGVLLSAVIFLLPSLYGEGYDIVARVVNGDKSPLLSFSPFYKDSLNLTFLLVGVGIVLLIKGAAVGATNSGGGAAGEFAPTIFAGCLMGYLFGCVINHFFGANVLPEDFALIGTCAVMAGTLRAPVMAIFIAAEISNRYNFVLAFIAAAASSFFIAEGLRRLPKLLHKP